MSYQRRVRFKVTVYLQGCLTSERCSASGLNLRYLQIKACRAGYQTISRILKLNEFSNFSQPLNASVRITFSKLHVLQQILLFAILFCSSVSRPKVPKKVSAFCHTQLHQKLQNVFEIVLKKCEVFVQK